MPIGFSPPFDLPLPPGGGGVAQGPGAPYVPQNDPLVTLIILNTHMHRFEKTNFLPPGVPAAKFGGLDGGGQGSETFFMFCVHIWISHEILSILSVHKLSENHFFF